MEDKVAVSHYFIEDPNLAHQVEAFSYYFGDRRFQFESDAGVFSPGHVDPATDLLLHQLPALSGEVLDLGCGWGRWASCWGRCIRKRPASPCPT